MDNFTYFEVCDEHLKELLKPQNKMLFADEIPKTIQPKIIETPAVWSIIFNQLLVDGHIKEAFVKINDRDVKHYVLTAEGRVFIEEGGYNKYFLRKAKEDLVRLKLMESNIQVNKSVVENNRLQKRSIIATVIIIALSLATQIQTCNISNRQLEQNKKQKEQVQVYIDTIPINIIYPKKSVDSNLKK